MEDRAGYPLFHSKLELSPGKFLDSATTDKLVPDENHRIRSLKDGFLRKDIWYDLAKISGCNPAQFVSAHRGSVR